MNVTFVCDLSRRHTSQMGAGKVWLFLQQAQNPRAPMHLQLCPSQLCFSARSKYLYCLTLEVVNT